MLHLNFQRISDAEREFIQDKVVFLPSQILGNFSEQNLLLFSAAIFFFFLIFCTASLYR